MHVAQVYEKKPLQIKNFGIWLRYNSRSGTHNMYKEYRDLTTGAAVTQCCKFSIFIFCLNCVNLVSCTQFEGFSTSRVLAATGLCIADRDMGARHRARANSIQIIRVEVVPASKCRRPNIQQFHVSKS